MWTVNVSMQHMQCVSVSRWITHEQYSANPFPLSKSVSFPVTLIFPVFYKLRMEQVHQKEAVVSERWIYTCGVAAVIAALVNAVPPPSERALDSTSLIRITLRLNPPRYTRPNQSESKPLGASALVGCHVLCTQETNNPLAVLNASNQ